MNEIRSYRRVFDLERRIYSIERMRLNPAGVPVRGVLYLLGTICGALFASRLPVIGVAVKVLPWFVRDLGAPAALAAVLTVVRIDGRTFHHAAWSAASFWIAPRSTVGLCERARRGHRWRPDEVVFLPDGSDTRLRGCRYTGPGAVAVLVAHRTDVRVGNRWRFGRSTREIVLTAVRSPARLRRARLIAVDAGTSLRVSPDRGDRRR